MGKLHTRFYYQILQEQQKPCWSVHYKTLKEKQIEKLEHQLKGFKSQIIVEHYLGALDLV